MSAAFGSRRGKPQQPLLARQLLRSHLSVALLGVIMLCIALISTYDLRSKVIRLADEGGPLAQASLQVLAGVQDSIADLRGWVNLGNKNFLSKWQNAWSREIEPAMAAMKSHSKLLEALGARQHVVELEKLLADLKEAQWWVKDVARTPGNEPARVTYLLEVEPVATRINEALTGLIEQEKDQSDGMERKQLLARFAQAQNAFAHAQLQLREVVGELGLEYIKRFRQQWLQAQALSEEISRQQSLFTPEQSRLWALLQTELRAFSGLADRLIGQRSAPDWNLARYWIERETVPLGSRVIDLIAALEQDSRASMNREAASARFAGVVTVWLLALLIVTMLALAYILSRWHARSLARPLAALSQATQDLAAGRVTADIPVARNDELGDLTRAFNAMRAATQQAQEALREANASLERRIAERTAELKQTNAALTQEITDHRQAEEALQDSAARMRAIGNAIPDLLFELDEDGRYIEVLTSQRQLFKVASLKGKLLREVHPPDKADFFLEIIHRALQSGQIQVAEYELPVSAGKRWFESRTAPLDLPPGSKPAVVVVARDITERKLAETRLRQVQKMEAIGHLTGGVAHDFNNLLAVVSGNLELLNEALQENTPLRDLTRRALAATERGATLTQRLLAYSRQQPLRTQPTDLNKLVGETLDLLRRTLGETIQIRTELAGDLWPALIDPTQLESALLNLALNARDAMPDGGLLSIETANTWLDADYAAAHEDVQPGLYIMLTVSDTGSGMPPEVIEHAFEPFFTTKPVGKGSGLGLSMVYGLVKQCGGHVAIYSELGQGTTIRLYLPQARAAATSVAEPKAPETATQEGRAEVILVVEDDPHVRQLSVKMLNSLGYRTLETGDAWAALRLLEENSAIALLFTDVVLPGRMNGVQLAHDARRLRPDLKVLFTSGYTENVLIHNGQVQAGVELLAKPYRRSMLAAKMRQLLGSAPTDEPLVQDHPA